ncbi:MAG TPA: diphthamide biosynthesis enzyme Dph2 [Nitrososphaeraceae archaeon]|nr:diphthamide biosynthesis enzyme Dph2 [Nitrososphaeraceae archaeon]
MISIDEDKIFEVIKKRKPLAVALNGPEALFPKIQETCKKIMNLFDIPAYVIGDTCWGSCDLNTHAADKLGADLLFNIGHTISMETMDKKVIMINAYDDVKFDNIVKKFAEEITRENLEYKTLSLLTDSQHLNQLQPSKKILENYGFKIIIGDGKGQLNDGQVFGCEFYPAYDIQRIVDAYIFLGQSMFHSVSIAMATEKPTFMLDPYFNEFHQVNDNARTMEKKAILSIYKAQEAEKIGIIIGLKEGQFAKIKALKLKKTLEALEKEIQLFALTEITEERLRNFKGIDAFIQVACPRIAIDNHFSKPLLSVPQAEALIKILKNEPIDDFLRIRHWL